MIRFGLLDAPGLLLHAIDYGLHSFVPLWLTLVIWALVSAYASIWVYRRYSNQKLIASLQPDIQRAQQRLLAYRGPLVLAWPILARRFALAWVTLGPALLAALPVVLIVIWVARDYGHTQPAAGSRVAVSIHGFSGAAEFLSWVGAAAEPVPGESFHWILAWPANGGRAALLSVRGDLIASLPTQSPVRHLSKWHWWNFWIANPAGYLDPGALAESICIDVPAKAILPIGPGWMRGWALTYFLIVLSAVWGLKRVFGLL